MNAHHHVRLDRQAPSNYSRKERILDPLSYLHNIDALPPLPGHAYSWEAQQEIKKSLTVTEEVAEQGGVQEDVKETLSAADVDESQAKDLLTELLSKDISEDKGPHDYHVHPRKIKSKKSIEISQSPGATQLVYFPLHTTTDTKLESEKIPTSILRMAKACGKSLGKDTRGRIGPGQYSAIEIHGNYGFIDILQEAYDGGGHEKVLMVHTPSRIPDKTHMLSIQPGDTVDVVYVPDLSRGRLEITFVTRSKYFSPGCPVTSLQVGVLGWKERTQGEKI